MKKITMFALVLGISSSFSQEFWEPAQFSFQVKQYALSNLAIKETQFTRQLENRVIYNISNSIKLNNFEFSLGAMTTETQSLTYQWGISYFYRGEGSSPFLSYSRSGNWMVDKWDKKFHYIRGTSFRDSSERSVYLFDMGYRFTRERFSVQTSMGFVKGMDSKAKMVAPVPQISLGVVYQIWRTRQIQEADFK